MAADPARPGIGNARRWGDGRTALALFFAALLVYFLNAGALPPDSDSVPNLYMPASLLAEGDPSFSPFEVPFMFLWATKDAEGRQVPVRVSGWTERAPGSTKSYAEHYQEGRLKFSGWKYYLVPTARERLATGEPLFVGAFGPGAGMLMLPLIGLAHAAGAPLGPPLLSLLGKLTAALLVAGSAALVYATAAALVSRRSALFVAAAYAFGSCAWAVASQSLWQQTAELFFLSFGTFFLVRFPAAWWRAAAAGAAYSAATFCRPTAVVVAAVAAAMLLVSDRRAFVHFVLGALPLVIAALGWNFYYFGSPFDFGQLAAGERVASFKTGSPELWQTPLWLGAAGLLVSPSRGLLVYSPVFALAFAGALIAWRDERWRPLRFLTLAVPALWLPAFLWFDWWGGWAFGYRPIMDTLPLLALLVLPVIGTVLARPAWRAAFAVLLAWSIGVQALGAFAYSPWSWNLRPIDAAGNAGNVDLPEYRHRLWSFSDWQIGYLVTHYREARAERKKNVTY